MTELVTDVDAWRSLRAVLDSRTCRIGFVPTMGALHRGHRSLIDRSVEENDHTVVSVFVNPTQFDSTTDLASYPKDLEADAHFVEAADVDFLFAPTEVEMYPDRGRFHVGEADCSTTLCGAHRPGHFQGVLTIVLRLLQLIRPHRAYFGEKDYQQFSLIRDMAGAFFLDVQIVPCPTVRDSDGVAASSRNSLLTASGRAKAVEFAGALRESVSVESLRTALSQLGLEVEYIEDRHGRRFAAVRIEGVRLIDNVILTRPAQTDEPR